MKPEQRPERPQRPQSRVVGRTYLMPHGRGTITFTEKGYVKRPASPPRPPVR